MAEYIKSLKLDARFIPILAGEKRLMKNTIMETFEKEDLIMETLKKCEEALQGDMRSLVLYRFRISNMGKNEKIKG